MHIFLQEPRQATVKLITEKNLARESEVWELFVQIVIHVFFKPCYVKAIKNILKKVPITKGVAGCDELQAIELGLMLFPAF